MADLCLLFEFLRAVGLAGPHWYGNNASKENKFQPDEQRFTDDLSK